MLLAGPPIGPPVILLHGTRMSRTMWRPVLDHLAQSHRCAAIDLPGHGELAGERFTLASAAARVAEVATMLAAETDRPAVTIVGLSLGGYVAIETAARHREVVAGLVLAGCSREPIGALAAAMRLLAAALELAGGRPADLVSRVYFRLRYGRATTDAILSGGLWGPGGAVAMRELTGQAFRHRLAAADRPGLVVNGAWDLVFRPGGRAFARAAGGSHVVLRRAAHLTNLDRPAAFARAVSGFVTSVTGESSDRLEHAPGLY